LRNQDGDPADAAGAVTCNIARADGTVLATGRAATNPAGAGTVEVALTTSEAAQLDVIRVVWLDGGVERASSWHRLVGGFLFGLSELQAKLGMANVAVPQLRAERDRITDLIERETGVCWSPQYDLEECAGYGRSRHVTRWRPLRSVRSLTIDGVAISAADLDIDEAAGVFEADQALSGWMTVGYEHGFDQPTDSLRDAALIAAADRLQREFSALSSRVRRSTNDMGMTVEYSFAGRDHPTGIDEVDAVIVAHDMRSPGFA
jgi:hypothetical protein